MRTGHRSGNTLLRNCYLTMHCKHEYAVMRTLRQLLKELPQKPNYFAAIEKNVLLSFAFNPKHEGEITLNIKNGESD